MTTNKNYYSIWSLLDEVDANGYQLYTYEDIVKMLSVTTEEVELVDKDRWD